MDITTEVVETFDNTFEEGNLFDTFSQVGEFAIDQAIQNDVLKDLLYLIQISYLLENQEGFCKRGDFSTTFPQQFQLV